MSLAHSFFSNMAACSAGVDLVCRVWTRRNIAAFVVYFRCAINAHFQKKTTIFQVGKLESLLRIVCLALKKPSSKAHSAQHMLSEEMAGRERSHEKGLKNRRRAVKKASCIKRWRLLFKKRANFSMDDCLLREFCIILRRSAFWSEGAILTLPWQTTDQQDRFCYLFGLAVRFDWINFDVWLKQAFWIIWVDPNCH